MPLKYLENKASGLHLQFKQELLNEFLNTEIIALDIFPEFYIDDNDQPL